MMDKSWRPSWWKDEMHGSAWDRVRDAMKRDWEQTKSDLGMGGRDLGQDAGDTVKQAMGKEPVPASGAWNDVEMPMGYGYGARRQYGEKHPDWNDELEGKLRTEWSEAKGKVQRGWDDVKSHVRRGYEYDARQRRLDKTG